MPTSDRHLSTGWAIRTGEDEPRFVLRESAPRVHVPAQLAGYEVAVFDCEADAHTHLKAHSLHGVYPTATVVPCWVGVSSEEPPE